MLLSIKIYTKKLRSHRTETKYQIDQHVTINRKWRHSLTDARALKEIDVSSDHVLVGTKIKLTLRTNKCYSETDKNVTFDGRRKAKKCF